MTKFSLTVPHVCGETLEFEAKPARLLFLVGANGTGKSTLLHHLQVQHIDHARRVTAHRQVWFSSDSLDITPMGRQQTEKHTTNVDRQAQSRWKDELAAQRAQAVIFDLVDSENVEARRVYAAARSGDQDVAMALAATPSPLERLNLALQLGNLDLQVSIEAGTRLAASRSESEKYSAAELSDGERNAILIAANVLTAPPETLLLIDEPERHLHRSIVSPLLNCLLEFREDCAFIVSTHDVQLPIDAAFSSALLMRSYRHQPTPAWNADYLADCSDLDDEIGRAVLGARKQLLFIEGAASSLDTQLYSLLFPSVSVHSSGGSSEVQRKVKGARATEAFHWLEVFGLVDRDCMTDAECLELQEAGIFAIEHYSIESLYYHPAAFKAVMRRCAALQEIDIPGATEAYRSAILQSASEHAKRLAARRAEKRARDRLLSNAPNWKSLLKGELEISVTVEDLLQAEHAAIAQLISDSDVGGLMARYPLRETPALAHIAAALGFSSRNAYESAVRKAIADGDPIRTALTALLQPLANAVSPTPQPEPAAAPAP